VNLSRIFLKLITKTVSDQLFSTDMQRV